MPSARPGTAWRGLADLRDLERLDAWFGRILVNACRDRLRRRKVRPLAVDLPEGVEARDRTADIDRDGPGGRRPCAHVPRNSRGTPLIAFEP